MQVIEECSSGVSRRTPLASAMQNRTALSFLSCYCGNGTWHMCCASLLHTARSFTRSLPLSRRGSSPTGLSFFRSPHAGVRRTRTTRRKKKKQSSAYTLQHDEKRTEITHTGFSCVCAFKKHLVAGQRNGIRDSTAARPQTGGDSRQAKLSLFHIQQKNFSTQLLLQSAHHKFYAAAYLAVMVVAQLYPQDEMAKRVLFLLSSGWYNV